MTYSLFMDPVPFWGAVNASRDALVHRDSLSMVAMSAARAMNVILRTTEELFTVAAPRIAGGAARVIVNGNFYDLTSSGMMDAMVGHDPVAANETTPLGQIIERGSLAGGASAAQMFYWAQVTLSGPPAPGQTQASMRAYESGFGDPPQAPTVREALGGLGPMIIRGLRYGDGNRYRPGAPATPATGQPPAASLPYLIQRNNNTFVSAAQRPRATGKTILGYAPDRDTILVVVQQDGSSGQTLETIRDRLFELSFTDAVFLDGSDSSCLWFDGSWRIMPGEDKDETNTIGVAFG